MKQYTMEGFINGKFAVKVNQKNCKKFLEMCEKHRLCWASGKKANEFTPDFDMPKSEIAIGCEERSNGICLAYGRAYVIEKFGRPVIDYKDFMDGKDHSSYQILIDCDGTTTTATMTINGREIKTAIARRNPDDKFDWRKGAEMAFERLWNSPKKLGEKPEVREVKRWAEPGEYIKIVNVYPGYQEAYHNGDIFQVTGYRYGIRNGWVSVKGTNIAMRPEEYIVLEGYRP